MGQKLYELAVLAKEFLDADDDVAAHGWNSDNDERHQNAKTRLAEMVATVLSHPELKEDKMIDIPENPAPRNFDAEVDEAVKYVLKDLQSSSHGVAALSVNHGRARFHVMNDVAARVASLFRERGYHAHYCHAVDGTPYSLEITTYPTNHDI